MQRNFYKFSNTYKYADGAWKTEKPSFQISHRVKALITPAKIDYISLELRGPYLAYFSVLSTSARAKD